MGGGAVFIRQIINNNVVLVRDTGGKELIVVAKGIGYHGRTGAAASVKVPVLSKTTYFVLDSASR